VSEEDGAPAAPPERREKRDLPDGAVPVTIRRAPRYRAFVLAGAVLGLVAGAVTSLVLGGSDTSPLSPTTVTGYVGAIGLLVGGLLGAAVAVLVERPRR
jgi:hypothetical protein